jgi:hypothetical protein
VAEERSLRKHMAVTVVDNMAADGVVLARVVYTARYRTQELDMATLRVDDRMQSCPKSILMGSETAEDEPVFQVVGEMRSRMGQLNDLTKHLTASNLNTLALSSRLPTRSLPLPLYRYRCFQCIQIPHDPSRG